MISNHYF